MMLLIVQVYNEMFTDATAERTELMFHYLDPDNTGYVDYLGWSQSIKLQVCGWITVWHTVLLPAVAQSVCISTFCAHCWQCCSSVIQAYRQCAPLLVAVVAILIINYLLCWHDAAQTRKPVLFAALPH